MTEGTDGGHEIGVRKRAKEVGKEGMEERNKNRRSRTRTTDEGGEGDPE